MNGWAKTKQTGFTIVELLIVIVVIGILAAITIVAYTGVQGGARDAERKSDIAAAQKALEMYFVNNGSYPKQGSATTASMQSMAFVTSEAFELSREQATPPGKLSSIDDNTAFTESGYGHSMDPGRYAYRAYTDSSAPCWMGSSICSGYQLWYGLERHRSNGVRTIVTVGGTAPCPGSDGNRVQCIRTN